MTAASHRRTLVAALAAAPLLGACGFKMRGTYQMPFDTIYLGVAPNSALGADLARRITAGTNTKVVDEAKDAQAILEVLNETRTRDVLSVNAQGRAQEFTLRQTMTFRLHDGKGREFLGATQVAVKRDVAFDDSQTLAFESETELLYRDMQSDLVQQMLRRIAAVKGVKE
jgi:LPS-assembly lipoprotein